MAVRLGFLAGEKRAAKNVDNVDKPKRASRRKDARKKKRRFFLHFRPKYEKMEGWRKEKSPARGARPRPRRRPAGIIPKNSRAFPGYPHHGPRQNPGFSRVSASYPLFPRAYYYY